MPAFGGLEARVMDRLWSWGRAATVREVQDDLHDSHPVAYTTVMTVMDKLHRKGWLERDLDGRAYRYWPVRTRQEYTSALLVETLGDPAERTAALVGFVDQMSPDELEELRAALGRARRRSRQP